MRINYSNKIMLSFIWLLIAIHLCTVCNASRRIFDTTIIPKNTNTFDCLISPEPISWMLDGGAIIRRRSNFVETYQYCRRSTLPNSQQIFLMKNLLKTNHSAFTFDELRSMNVTYQQLYKWYAPTDVIEEYIAGTERGLFVNCSNTMWFGSQCEYTFDTNSSLMYIASRQFEAKHFIPPDLSLYTNGTCYEMNNTGCESVICLDWREICDGKIDCKNGYDERYCHELEMNECNATTESRCYDGQCINNLFVLVPKACFEQYSWQNSIFPKCFKEYGIRCENQKCPKLFFSCGDGYCYDGPSIGNRSCATQRDRRYLEQMSSSSLILFSHIILNYTNNTQPQYICYNQTLCPYLSFNNQRTTKDNNGLTCHSFETFSNRTYNHFDEMVKDIKHLLRSCSLLPLEYNDPHHTCSMYRCHDGSKCFSFHRLSDDIEDCINGEDESERDVCTYNLTGRFTCDNGTKCIPQQLILDTKSDCIDYTDENLRPITLISCRHPFSSDCGRTRLEASSYNARFEDICNGMVEYKADLNNNTDESDCIATEWPCDGYYSKCDSVWNCPDGRDELGCNYTSRSSLYCNNTAHFCLEIAAGNQTCLYTSAVDDGIIDCVGSFDERDFCRSKYPFDRYRRYRCRNSTECIYTRWICDGEQDCPENDDETTACSWLRHEQENDYSPQNVDCFGYQQENYDGRIDLLCDLDDERDNGMWFAQQRNTYPIAATQHRVKRQTTEDPNYHVIWSCNRGLYVRSTKDPEGFACFCPDHYYGDRCQYQRKRIWIIFTMEMLTAFNQGRSSSIFAVLLVHTNQSNTIILSHVQFLYITQYQEDWGPNVQLLYPIVEPYRSWTNNSVRVHMIDRQTHQYRKSWTFPLPFEFLPVQHLFKTISIPELNTKFESREMSIHNQSCTSCSNDSLCIGHDVSLGQDVCICPVGYAGRRCLLPFDSCININCSGHGKCQPTGIYYNLDEQFICLCDSGWYGYTCDKTRHRINVLLSQELAFLSSSAAFLHLTYNVDVLEKSQKIYLQRFQRETLNITFILDHLFRFLPFGFIQFYEHQDKFDYYLLFTDKFQESQPLEMTYEVQLSHRCRSVNELFHRKTLDQPDIRRVKNYQQPCLQRYDYKDRLVCFYDDYLMCICKEDNHTVCFNFQANLTICDGEWCNSRGMCVTDDKVFATYSRCICEKCAYGSFCEHSTDGYSLSLDGIIGSHISLTVSSIFQQSSVVQIAVAIISLVAVLGIILNFLSIITFIRKETHEVGCGFYLLMSSIIGLVTPVVLVCKIVLLLKGDGSPVSCSIIEFFLKWCPTSCEWLNVCVAFERAVAVKHGTKYSRSKSKYFAKWTIPLVLILVGCICMSEFFFRGIVVDQFDNRAWCVMTLNNKQPGLLAFYSLLNICSFLIPLLINLSSSIIIVLSKVESKQKANGNNQKNNKQNMTSSVRLALIRKQILKHKHILIGPVLLGLLSLPRIALLFIFVCTKLDQNSIPSLLAYLVPFLPSMAVIFAFVWPSETYRASFIKSIKTIFPNRIQNLFTRRN